VPHRSGARGSIRDPGYVADPEAAKRIAYVLTPARADGSRVGALVAILLREPRLRGNRTAFDSGNLGHVFVLLAWSAEGAIPSRVRGDAECAVYIAEYRLRSNCVSQRE